MMFKVVIATDSGIVWSTVGVYRTREEAEARAEIERYSYSLEIARFGWNVIIKG